MKKKHHSFYCLPFSSIHRCRKRRHFEQRRKKDVSKSEKSNDAGRKKENDLH